MEPILLIEKEPETVILLIEKQSETVIQLIENVIISPDIIIEQPDIIHPDIIAQAEEIRKLHQGIHEGVVKE